MFKISKATVFCISRFDLVPLVLWYKCVTLIAVIMFRPFSDPATAGCPRTDHSSYFTDLPNDLLLVKSECSLGILICN